MHALRRIRSTGKLMFWYWQHPACRVSMSALTMSRERSWSKLVEWQAQSTGLTHKEGATNPMSSCSPPSVSGQPFERWNCVPAREWRKVRQTLSPPVTNLFQHHSDRLCPCWPRWVLWRVLSSGAGIIRCPQAADPFPAHPTDQKSRCSCAKE